MKEIDSRYCMVGGQKVYQLKVFETSDGGLVGELYRTEVAYLQQDSDADPISIVESSETEEIRGSNVEQIAEKARTRILDLGYEFSRWRKGDVCNRF